MSKRMRRWSLLWLAALSLTGAVACEPVEGGAAPGSYALSSRLGISADGQTLYMALPDHDLVRAVDAASGEVTGEVSVSGSPHRLTVLSDGRVAVSARLAGTVSLLSEGANEVLSTVEVGSDPHGLLEVDGKLVVAVSGQKELARIDLSDATHVKDRVALEHDAPRGLALAPDGTLFVSHFHSGVLSTVDVDQGVPSGTVGMNLPSNPFFVPNQLDSLTVTPDGTEVVVPHQECNNDPAQFGAGGTDFTGSVAVAEYYVQGPTGYPAVVPAVSRVDTTTRVNVSDGPGALDPMNPSPAESEGPAPAIINPLDTEKLGNDVVNSPVAIALADGGAVELLVNKGSGNVLVRRAHLGPNQRSVLGMVDVGVGASSIVLSPDGDTAYVWNDFTHELVSFAVPDVEDTAGGTGVSIARHETDDVWQPFGGAHLPRLERTVVAKVAEDVLPPEVVRGRVLFHTVDERLTRRGAISCASCHPGGGPDSITWRFAEGPRQTPPLWGGIMDTAPFHWDQMVTTVETLNSITIQGRMAGAGLSGGDLRDIGAFIDTIPVPAPPMSADEASVERGLELFFSEATACSSCHAGSDFTDGLAHNVGTGRGLVAGETIDEIATPVLHGLAHSAPYMHDGSAESLEDLVERYVRTDRMGRGSHLSDQDAADLVAFLKTL